jgi:hypothetical protein
MMKLSSTSLLLMLMFAIIIDFCSPQSLLSLSSISDNDLTVPIVVRVVFLLSTLGGNNTVSTFQQILASSGHLFQVIAGSQRLFTELQSTARQVPHSVAAIDAVLAADWSVHQSRLATIYIFESGIETPYRYNDGPCAFAHGIALDDRSRFAWLDLSVGGVSFGPMASGEGGVYNMADSFHNYVALANFLHLAHAHLVAPAPVRAPQLHASSANIMLIHIRDHDSPFDTAPLAAALAALRLLPAQTLHVSLGMEYELHECVECLVALDLATFTAAESLASYLDSRTLVDALDRFALGGRNTAEFVVYVIDLERRPLRMLDGKHLAVARDNRVVAVQSRATQTMQTDFFCNAQRAISLPVNDSSNAIFGALLTSLFGIGAHPYLFDMMRSPFSPIAGALTTPHFGIRDAAARHQLLHALNSTHRYLELIDTQPPLNNDEYHLALKHWTALVQKRQELLHSIAVYDFDDAHAQLMALRDDALAIGKVMHEAASRAGIELECDASRRADTRTHETFWFFVNALTSVALLLVMLNLIRRRCGWRRHARHAGHKQH